MAGTHPDVLYCNPRTLGPDGRPLRVGLVAALAEPPLVSAVRQRSFARRSVASAHIRQQIALFPKQSYRFILMKLRDSLLTVNPIVCRNGSHYARHCRTSA
jgi:hypothetical protein